MKNIINSYFPKKNFSFLILLLLIGSWIHQWISIGTFINLDFSNFNFDFTWILSNRNLLILILPLNLILFFLLKKKNKNFIIFYLIFISYLIGLINFHYKIAYNSFDNILNIEIVWHLTFVLNILCTILILNNLSALDYEKKYKIFISINLIILFLIVFFIFFQKGNLSTNPIYYLNIFGNNNIITSNGISRSIMVIFIFAFCASLKKKNKINFFLIFLSSLLSYLIIANEGRVNFISLIIAILLILFLVNLFFKKKVLIFFLVFILPLTINIFLKSNDIISNDKIYNEFNKGRWFALNELKKNRLFSLQGEIRGNNLDDENQKIYLNTDLHERCNDFELSKFLKKINIITTGRVRKWICVLKNENDIIFGNGPEYDREILEVKSLDQGALERSDSDTLKQGQDVANGAIYALISGGLIGLLCYLIIIFRYFYLSINFLILKKNISLTENSFFIGSFITTGYLIGRSFFENGIASYGIDFLIFIICYFFIFEIFNKSENNYQNP